MSLCAASSPFPSWKEIHSFYGDLDQAADAQVYIEPPYPMVLAWDVNAQIHRIRCHTKVAPSLTLALEEIGSAFGEGARRRLQLDRFGGVYNRRRMRGGDRWSSHAWGIAIDLAPTLNGLNTPWPSVGSMPSVVVEIFESLGWTSGARAVGRDAMHFQALNEW